MKRIGVCINMKKVLFKFGIFFCGFVLTVVPLQNVFAVEISSSETSGVVESSETEIIESSEESTGESETVTDESQSSSIDESTETTSSTETMIPEESSSEESSSIESTEETVDSSESVLSRKLISEPSLVYQVHGQSYGWQAINRDQSIAGTVGRSKRVEAIKINIENTEYQGATIQYRTHVQKKGWTSWTNNAGISGTVGQKLQVEAIQVRLVGKIAEEYDIYYRVHSAVFGWLDWAKGTNQGASAGTSGLSTRVEALQMKLVKKGDSAGLVTTRPFVNDKQPRVDYQVHGQSYGWQNTVNNNTIAGSIGQRKRIEGIKMNVVGASMDGSIQYSAYVQNNGWQNYVNATNLAGTTGRGLRMEALRVRLTGTLSRYYDVYYRAHIETKGWLGWTNNDGIIGSIGANKRVEAIQVQIVKKSSAAPQLGKSFCTANDFHNPAINRNKLLNTARGQVSSYKYGSANKFTSKYNKAHNGWCTLFINYCFDQAGIRNLFHGGQYEWNPQIVYAYHKARGQVVSSPQPGDIAFVDWQGRGHITHAEIVESVGTNTVGMITGNWGNMVTRVNRPKGQVVGYVRPSY